MSEHWTTIFANVTANSPATQTPATRRVNRNVTEPEKWTMRRIDGLPGGRNNFVCVMVPNPKLGGYARENWHLYGEIMKPTVTVASYIKSYPTNHGANLRAERSLCWDLDRGFIRLVPAQMVEADKAPVDLRAEQD